MPALVGSVRTSFGIREELRVSVDLLDAVCALCDDYETGIVGKDRGRVEWDRGAL